METSATPWMTEHYRSFTIAGRRARRRANRAVSPKTMMIITDTPGFTAQIKAGDSATGLVPRRSPARGRSRARPQLSSLNGGGRYFLVWITNLGANDQVRIDEVTGALELQA